METKDIIVPYMFENTPPSKKKIQAHKEYFDATHKFLKPIIVNNNGTLLDGYIDYLIAFRYGIEMIDVTVKEQTEECKIKKTKKKKIKRKVYSRQTRKMIYDKADGRCQLCGKKILLSELSLDHILPLSMGGEDCVDNIQATCFDCNQLKRNCLPASFFERITNIFMYQMEKSDNKIKLQIARKLIESVE